MNEYFSIGDTAFEGFISYKCVKDVTVQSTNAAVNEPLQLPGTLE